MPRSDTQPAASRSSFQAASAATFQIRYSRGPTPSSRAILACSFRRSPHSCSNESAPWSTVSFVIACSKSMYRRHRGSTAYVPKPGAFHTSSRSRIVARYGILSNARARHWASAASCAGVGRIRSPLPSACWGCFVMSWMCAAPMRPADLDFPLSRKQAARISSTRRLVKPPGGPGGCGGEQLVPHTASV